MSTHNNKMPSTLTQVFGMCWGPDTPTLHFLVPHGHMLLGTPPVAPPSIKKHNRQGLNHTRSASSARCLKTSSCC